MQEIFTVRARRVLDLAKKAAIQADDDYVGTHHIMIGLIKEGSGVGHHILESNGLNATKIAEEAVKITQKGTPTEDPPFNPRAKKLFEYSVEEAKNLGHGYVGTEHLLLALLRDHESVACQILVNFGISLESLKKETLNILGFYDRVFSLKPADGDSLYSITVKDSSGEEIIGRYEKKTDELFLNRPLSTHEITRIIDAIHKPYLTNKAML